MKFPKVIYISCNPATLARDLEYLLENNYSINRIAPVDMFPQTSHVESVTLLSIK
jgi:23S rRNA (uracil1939-C5)-methyltransferase